MATGLSADDAVQLRTQTRTPTTRAHTVLLVVLGATEGLSHERLRAHLATSMPKVARFRSRLVGMPFGVAQPVWAEIDDYDPSPQIHRASVCAPGGEAELADLVSTLTDGPQDWGPDLWEAWTIDGLSAGRWALAVKISPLLASGALWECLLSAGPNADDVLATEVGPGPALSWAGQVADSLGQMAHHQVAGAFVVADAVTGALRELGRRLDGVAEVPAPTVSVPSMSGPVPMTAFNAPLTARRSMGLASIPLADVKAVSDAFGGNTANVLLTACTLSLREWLHRHDAVPAEPLSMEVPLSLPAGDPADDRHAAVVGQVRMPVQLDDPVQILSNLHTATERLSIANRVDDENSESAVDLETVMSLFPPSVVHAGMRVYRALGMDRRRAPYCHGTVSFVSARQEWAYCEGVTVMDMYAAEPLGEGRGLNISVNSSADVMNVCVSACPDNVPEVGEIATGIADAVAVLLAAAARAPRGRGRSVVTEMTSHTSKRSTN